MNLPWKYIVVSFLIGLIVGGALGVGASRSLRRRFMKHGPEIFVERLDRKVHLTATQRSEIEAVLKENRAKIQAVHDETFQTLHAEIRKRLTPEQQPAFDQMIARMEARRKKWEGR